MSQKQTSFKALGLFSLPSAEVSSHEKLETLFLLRHFQDGIAVWMDLFDHSRPFQLLQMRRAVDSELLRTSICAVASQQLSLKTKTTRWKTAADRYYGDALRLLLSSLGTHEDVNITLPASNLLLSFELLAGVGQDYSRHFYGAIALIETHIETIRHNNDALLKASYWNFFRQDVDIALGLERPTSLKSDYWIHESASEEDGFGNQALLITAEATTVAFGSRESKIVHIEERTALLDKLEGWMLEAKSVIVPLEWRISDSEVRSWYPTPSGAAAMQLYFVVMMLMNIGFDEDAVQQGASEIIKISESCIADGAQVQAVRLLYQAAKHTKRGDVRDKCIEILKETQIKTGFSTDAEVNALEANT
jgi:hypothetical protein